MQHNLLPTSDCIEWAIAINANDKVYYDELIYGPHGPYFNQLSILISSKIPRQLLWHVVHSVNDTVKCRCGNLRKWVKNLNNYRLTCSPSCAGQLKSSEHIKPEKVSNALWYKDPVKLANAIAIRRKNSIEKYGIPSPNQTTTAREKRRSTNISKYGVEHVGSNSILRQRSAIRFKENHLKGSENHKKLISKRASTNIKKYGVLHPMKSNMIKDKHKDTMITKYGVEHALQNTLLNQKRKNTNLKKYGIEEAIISDTVIAKITNTNISKYGVENSRQSILSLFAQGVLFDKNKFEQVLTGKTLDEAKDHLDVALRTIINYANKYNLRHIFSNVKMTKIESKINELLLNVIGSDNYQINSRSVIKNQELDFYIANKNLAIEVNGLYWHTQVGGSDRSNNYHLNKWKECNKLGITLLQFTNIDIEKNWQLVESKIKRYLGISVPIIGARKLEISINTLPAIEREFMNTWHLQGHNSSRNLVLSATYNDEIVAMSTWKYKDGQAELVRFATNINYSFPGLLSKMISKFIKEVNFCGKIISYSNNCYGNGNAYLQCGFILDSITPPGYWYTLNYLTLESRIKYQKHKLSKLFNLSESDILDKTEWQIMQDQGYDRYWDAGHIKWIKLV